MDPNAVTEPDPGLLVDFKDDVEPPGHRQGVLAIVAFIISFLPVIGYIGLVLAAIGVWRAHRDQRPTPGLLYAALAIQLLYTIITLVLLVLLPVYPSLAMPSMNTPAAKTGSRFVQAMQSDPSNAIAMIDTDDLGDPAQVTSGYRDYITTQPELVHAQTVMTPMYRDAGLKQHHANDQPVSLQVWYIGESSVGARYLELVLTRRSDNSWRVSFIKGVEASPTTTVTELGRQLEADILR